MLAPQRFFRHRHGLPSDGNAAAAYVSYAFTETAFGYPIEPSTPAFERVEEWAHKQQRKNALGVVPTCVMLEHEGGVAGAMHGASSTGTLSTAYTSSQGLLLMYPNLFKMRYAQVPAVVHVASRALFTSLLTIECDHSDVNAVRSAGIPMMSSACVQDVHDLAAVVHASAIKASVPFLHFYDGFRTSHQIENVDFLDYAALGGLVDKEALAGFRARAFNPNHPSLRMIAGDSSFLFQAETAAAFKHDKVAETVSEMMRKVSKLSGRSIDLFSYHGDPGAESVIVIMGANALNVGEAVDYLNAGGKRYGVITVRLLRPFSAQHLIKAIPRSCKVVTVLDRVYESGAYTQPLHADVSVAIAANGVKTKVLGGVYGLGGRELTPSQAGEVFENSLRPAPHNRFTIGIVDDLLGTSLPMPAEVDMSGEGTKQCIFWGLGSDGTVEASHGAISIIAGSTSLYGQGFFLHDTKKSGGITRSHVRFGPRPITSNYQIQNADYVGVNSPRLPARYSVTRELKHGGIFVLNCPASNISELEQYLPPHIRRQLADREAQLFWIDATRIAASAGIQGRVELIMQTVFFKLAGVLPVDKAIALLKGNIEKQYGVKGKSVVEANLAAIDHAISGIRNGRLPPAWSSCDPRVPPSFADVPLTPIMRDVMVPFYEMRGYDMTPSQLTPAVAPLSPDGYGTSRFEKRGVGTSIPIWDSSKCIQCNSCSIGCAHAVIRPRILGKGTELPSIPSRRFPGYHYRIDVSPYDCLSCGVCISRCPSKALSFAPVTEELLAELEKLHVASEAAPDTDELAENDAAVRRVLDRQKYTAQGAQYLRPLLEFSGACAGCHEPLYAKLLTQFFGSRMVAANAIGCSSVWGGAFPSIPFRTTRDGGGISSGTSLLEDNAEFGFGIYAAYSHRRDELRHFVEAALDRPDLPTEFRSEFSLWIEAFMDGDESLKISDRISAIFAKVEAPDFMAPIKERLDLFCKPSFWIIGGDGWANDIGFGGLDHVIASGANVNILVYDNESYANSGFQMSKATPRGAVVKLATTGRDKPKKTLAQMMLQYKDAYIANCAIAADPEQTAKAIKEADTYNGPSLIIGYSACIGQGIKEGMGRGHRQANLAVQSGYVPLWRRHPKEGFMLDSTACDPNALKEMINSEVRYEALGALNNERFRTSFDLLKQDRAQSWKVLQGLAKK
jgi:pyruvate-ferredoxin/flavodoxin oxidoreductase